MLIQLTTYSIIINIGSVSRTCGTMQAKWPGASVVGVAYRGARVLLWQTCARVAVISCVSFVITELTLRLEQSGRRLAEGGGVS